MDKDYKKFCMRCNWNDSDYGCTCPSDEEVWQCDMYQYYHPEEVEQFERDMDEWAKEARKNEKG